MNIKAVIFDLDGTLVNSLEDIADSMNHVLQSFNFPIHETEAYKYFVGNGIKKTVIATLPEKNRNEQTIEQCFSQMKEVYAKNCMNKTKPYEGIIDMLNELKSCKLKLCVFSNKTDELTKKVVQKLMPRYFEFVEGLTNDEYKKPNPFIALQIAKKLNIEPENIIYVGDTNIDMQTANNAGMFPIGVLWGFRTKEELLSGGAKNVIEHPLDLLKLIRVD